MRSQLRDLDVRSSINLAVEAYKKSNFGVLRAILNNVQAFEYIKQLRDYSLERQNGNISAAFETAAITGNTNEVLALILLTSSTLQKKLNLNTALVNAAVYDHQDIVHILLKDKKLQSSLLERKRKAVLRNGDLRKALYVSCATGNILDVASILLNKPNIDLSEANNLALKTAIRNHHELIVKLLLTNQKVRGGFDNSALSMESNENLNIRLINACKNGDVNTLLDFIISDRVDASLNNNEAVLIAFKNGHDEIAKILINNVKVKESLGKIQKKILDIYKGSLQEAYLYACEQGHSLNVLAMHIGGELSFGVKSTGLLAAYRNHKFDTAKIISRLNLDFHQYQNINNKLESLCQKGDIAETVELLASGYVDPSFRYNQALNFALAAGHTQIATLLKTDERVTDLAKKLRSEALIRSDGDVIKAILSASGAQIQNSSVLVSLLFFEDFDPHKYAVSSLSLALISSNLEIFNILYRSGSVSNYLREIFQTILNDFKKNNNSEKSEEDFLLSCFKSENVGKVFSIIHRYFIDQKRLLNTYSDTFIERGLLLMDENMIKILTRIPELEEWLDLSRSRAFSDSNAETSVEAFEKSCQQGDLKAVYSFLLSYNFVPSIKGLELAVLSQKRNIVEVLLSIKHINNHLVSQKKRLINAEGDKMAAFRKAYTSKNGTMDTICLTLLDDDIDITENNNEAIRTSLINGKPEIFMVLAYNQNVFKSIQGMKEKVLAAYSDEKEALIESCKYGLEDVFLTSIVVDVMHGSLDPSFDSNVALTTAFKHGNYIFASILLKFENVQLTQIIKKITLIKQYTSWKDAFNVAIKRGRFNDVVILTVGYTLYQNINDGLVIAAERDLIDIVDYLLHIIPFENRLYSFKALCKNGIYRAHGDFWIISRPNILRDGVDMLSRITKHEFTKLHYLKLRFKNSLGMIEGYGDAFGPGPFKEFLNEIWREALKPKHKLFEATEKGEVIIYSSARKDSKTLNIYYQLGRVLGKAILLGLSLDVPFADFVYTKLLMRKSSSNELQSLDPALYKNLLWLQTYDGNVEDLGLTFSITEIRKNSLIVTHDLCPNGSKIPVTNTNRDNYISEVLLYKMDIQSSSQYSVLVKGFESVISKKYSRLFSPSELKTVIYGDNHTFTISDLKPHVKFYNSNEIQRNYFWHVLEELTPKERNDFLFYVTSSYRPAVGGFKFLDPPLSVVFVSSIPRTGLPEARTCVNSLYISADYSLDVMKEKIKAAIRLNDGFFYS